MEESRKTNIEHPTSKSAWRASASVDVRGWALVVGCFLSCLCRADDIGDITATADAMYSGTTFHGYAETRVVLQNNSHTKTHVVTLSSPDHSYNSGNSIGRIARAVKLAPGARASVPLLQPPLPASGDGSIRVAVDNGDEGKIRQPNANNHCNQYGSSALATVFLSRGLDADAVARVFNAGHGAYTAAMAVGAPDAGGFGMQAQTWVPDTRRRGLTNWLELDYAATQAVTRVTVHQSQSPQSGGTLKLLDIAGTVVATVPFSAGRTSSSSSGYTSEFPVSPTNAAVKTVRLEFGKIQPYNIAIDAVEIEGPSGSQWAADARASSDNSASGPRYTPGYAPGRSGSPSDSIQTLRAESALPDWSEDWLAYTPFDVVALSAADFETMPAPVAAAIGNYLQAGGNVVVFGAAALPAGWRSSKEMRMNGATDFECGLGHCLVIASQETGTLNAQTARTLREKAASYLRYWDALPKDGAAANASLPVVENLKIPVRGIVIIMLLFIIAIGPANLFILSRKNRRTWMLWTIPAISFATTLLVFAYSMLREGITPDTRIAGLTVLDQAAHHAVTVGATGFYCPLTPGGGLRFEGQTEATPLVHTGYYDRNGGSVRDVDWTQSQHFSRGWVASRVPAHFHLRKSETRRERLQVESENGRLQVVNGLGAEIQSLWVADQDMNFYDAMNVPAGQKAALMLSKEPVPLEKLGPERLLQDYGFTGLNQTPDAGTRRYLRPGTYIAVLKGNPFIENALGSAASAKRTKSSALVFGYLEGENK